MTVERLTELVDVIPRAGPKFRLGMYFDTIHEIPEFDAIKDPEGGYASCWETDTDFDDETGSFLFASLDGDSASVICLDEDEASQLLEKWKNNHQEQPVGFHVKEQPRMATNKPSCPNPGSDGTYEHVEGDTQYDDHIYESIDDCVDRNQISLNESADSNDSLTHTPTHTRTTKVVATTSQIHKTSMLLQKPRRSHTIPATPESPAMFTRKFSDTTEYAKLHRDRRHSQPLTKTDKVYQEPLYSSTMPCHASHKVANQTSEYAALSRPGEKSSTSKKGNRVPINIILKHKGKSYVLPIGEVKSDKPRKQSSTSTHHSSPKHSNSSIHVPQTSHSPSNGIRHSPTASAPLSSSANTISRSHSMGFTQLNSTSAMSVRPQGSPQRAEAAPPAGNHKRSKSKSYHQVPLAGGATQLPTHLTHYGVV